MMYSYFWIESALEDLATIYVNLSLEEQDRVSGGVDFFNRSLVADPHDLGESREHGYRVAFIPLLIVTFHIDKRTEVVQVLRVRRYGR
jgi:hypothetical protein